MKVDFISDVHLDFWIRELNPQNRKMDSQINTFISTILPNRSNAGDVLIIAGDLGHYFSQDSKFLLALKEIYKHIILVAGNHDLYLISTAQENKYLHDSNNRILEMKRFCKENDIHYLDGNTIVIDGYKFAGCGMSWDETHYFSMIENATRSDVTELFNEVMNDSRLIFGGKPNYRQTGMYGGYKFVSSFNPYEYFKKELSKLDKIDENDLIDVMVTHYAPHKPIGMREKYEFSLSSTFYYFDGGELINRLKPKFWIFGHTHDNYDYTYKNTHFKCNPLGYPGENTYNVIKSFEI